VGEKKVPACDALDGEARSAEGGRMIWLLIGLLIGLVIGLFMSRIKEEE
jgi:hypothetical protein